MHSVVNMPSCKCWLARPWEAGQRPVPRVPILTTDWRLAYQGSTWVLLSDEAQPFFMAKAGACLGSAAAASKVAARYRRRQPVVGDVTILDSTLWQPNPGPQSCLIPKFADLLNDKQGMGRLCLVACRLQTQFGCFTMGRWAPQAPGGCHAGSLCWLQANARSVWCGGTKGASFRLAEHTSIPA
jgi:hypothetical protein